MHVTSLENMKKCLDRYVEADFFTQPKRRRVADIGSMDVNGSYRSLFDPALITYTGVDMAAGPNVEVVLEDPYHLPFDTGSVDLVISGQMLEHCEFFWQAFQEMMRVVAEDGYLLLIAPSTGPIHRYPVDCYRFYPDAFHALAKFAGCHTVAVWRDERGPWCDLVGIFSKSAAAAGRLPRPSRVETQNTGSFPPAEDADLQRGRVAYLETLASIHSSVAPRRYVEIGVSTGKSLRLAACPSVAVDPEPAKAFAPPPACQFHRMPSDEFFEDEARRAAVKGFDLAFIDGLHLFEFALRDFMNLERLAHPASIIVIDDVFPSDASQATRARRTSLWTGDVWKIEPFLRQFRPDLALFKLDTRPTGLLLIAGLNPGNRVLWEKYSQIVPKFSDDGYAEGLDEAITRTGAFDPQDEAFTALLSGIARGRSLPKPGEKVRHAIKAFRQLRRAGH